MQAEFREIDLKGRVKSGNTLEFLRADVAVTHRLPFAVVYYTVGGQEQDLGLRLDLDKQVFLDHLPDAQQEPALTQALPQILNILAAELRV